MQFLPPQNQPVCWQPLYHRHFPTQLAAEIHSGKRLCYPYRKHYPLPPEEQQISAEILHFGASGNRELPELPELPDAPAEFRVPNDIRE